jgi:deoxycytidine triphosphate deaminase
LSYNYSTAIGYQSTINASNQIVLGRTSENVKMPGSYVGIGGVYNISSGYALDVSGNLNTTTDSYINGVRVGIGSGNVSSNTVLGVNALNVAGATGIRNVAIGQSALQNNTSGSGNVAIGFNSLQANSSGNNNVAVCSSSLQANISGNNNVAFGYDTLANNTTGSSNIAMVSQALFNNTTGSNNMAFGQQSLFLLTTGSNNVAVGTSAGIDLSGNSSSNTFLGNNTNVLNGTLVYNNSSAIGAGATIDATNQIVLGTSSEKIKIPGSYVGIGNVYNPSSGYALDVFGNVNVSGNFIINQNTIPATISTQLGYQQALPINSVTLSTSIKSLVLPPTLLKGVWIVEGFVKQTLSTAATVRLGLSLIALTFDPTRTIERYISGNLTFADRITAVFTISAPTTIYLLGDLTAGAGSTVSNSITYTRIG